ncbi:hypothetical protein J6590_028123 [Homalodisca vitripennis]|nr:hypothetical protein J6590_028123 [Homalodisca vitripennis]
MEQAVHNGLVKGHQPITSPNIWSDLHLNAHNVIQGMTQRFEDWNLSSSSGGGGINTYKNSEKKEGKGKGSNTPKSRLESSPDCHCTGSKSRAQVTSTRITITHHTSTGYSGILVLRT